MARIVFLGTPEFALPSLRQLMAAHELIAVVTQPDRPAGRNRRLKESPVKRLAAAAGIPTMQPRRLREPEAIAALARLNADLYVVVAFGQILPQAALDLPERGTLNVHASLLPRWRGAAPIQAAIRAGDAESGVTIMLLDAGLDTGPILSCRSVALAPDETGQSLHDRLAPLGADLLSRTIARYLADDIAPQAQADTRATYAPQLSKGDGAIDWTRPAAEIERLVRAFKPWPGTFTSWRGRRLTIGAGEISEGELPAGQVAELNGLTAIGTGAGVYLPSELQLAGKKNLPVADFVNGYRDFLGARLL